MLDNIYTDPNYFGVINRHGREIDFNTARNLMDDLVCDELHAQLFPCTKQTFFTAYERAHKEKFGEEWELAKENPVY